MNRTTRAAVALALGLALTPAATAHAQDDTCVSVEAVGPETIWADNPDHAPGYTIPGEPSQWWNWSPNKDQGPFDGPPSFPTDERGTWQGPHTEGGPGKGQTGTFQQGGGHGSWFHRTAGTEDVVVPPVGEPQIEVPNPDYTPARDCPPEPEPVISHGEWIKETDCATRTVTSTREVYSQGWLWDADAWAWVPGETVVENVDQNVGNVGAGQCPTVTPEKPETPEQPEAPAKDVSGSPVAHVAPRHVDELAETGAEHLGWIALGLLGAGAAMVALSRREGRRA